MGSEQKKKKRSSENYFSANKIRNAVNSMLNRSSPACFHFFHNHTGSQSDDGDHHFLSSPSWFLPRTVHKRRLKVSQSPSRALPHGWLHFLVFRSRISLFLVLRKNRPGKTGGGILRKVTSKTRLKLNNAVTHWHGSDRDMMGTISIITITLRLDCPL